MALACAAKIAGARHAGLPAVPTRSWARAVAGWMAAREARDIVLVAEAAEDGVRITVAGFPKKCVASCSGFSLRQGKREWRLGCRSVI